MRSWVCADAGLAIKRVFLDEPDAPLARALWAEWQAQKLTIVAPTLWAYEVTSVIRKQVYRRQMAPDDEPATLTAVLNLPVQLMRPPDLHVRASQMARRLNRPTAYDAHYLALAEMYACSFWTADERLFNAVHEELKWVHWLGNYRR